MSSMVLTRLPIAGEGRSAAEQPVIGPQDRISGGAAVPPERTHDMAQNTTAAAANEDTTKEEKKGGVP